MKTIRTILIAMLVFMMLISFSVPAVHERIIVTAQQNEQPVPTIEMPESMDLPSFRASADSQPVQEEQSAPVFELPKSLRIIEDEAFEGTAIVTAELPDTVEHIGERAFSDIPSLRSVTIPRQTSCIARTAFAGSGQVVINGAPDSYARTWARENGIRFVLQMVLYAGSGSIQITPLFVAQRIQQDLNEERQSVGRMNCSPQWRLPGDIVSEKIEQCIPDHLLGRAPPSIG